MNIQNKFIRIHRNRIDDNRGYFLKIIDGKEPFNPYDLEVYVTSAKPGESKGGHYHVRANEWFTLIKGEALLKIVNINTQERTEIKICGNNPETIFIPADYAHIFQNIGNEDFILLAYTDMQYEPKDTISYNF